MKKRFIPLLALLLSLCIIVPVSIAQIMAAGAVQINVTAKGGSVVIGDKTVKDGGKHSVSQESEEDKDITVDIKAVPDEGYVFGSWSVDSGTIENAKAENTKLTVKVDKSSVTLTANFVKTVGIQAKSSNDAWGTVTASAENAVPGGSGVTLTAEPKEGYRLDGWTVSYTNGDPMVDYSSRFTIYTLTEGEGNTATLAVSETNTEAKALTVTAHFEKADAGHFFSYDYCELQPLVFELLPGTNNKAIQVTVNLRVVQAQQMILVVGVAVGIAVLVHGNQLPLDQNLDGFLERRLFDAGILNDFLVRGPAVSLTAGAADQIRIQFELGGIQRHMEDAVGQTKEFFCGRFIQSHPSTSVCWSIHWINLSFGTRIRVPILM